jgi:hypothetical protein
MNRLKPVPAAILAFIAAAITALAAASCDMVYIPQEREIPDNPGITVITEDERDLLERTGRFLKLTNMPPYTQAANVMSVQIANSVSAIAALDKNKSVKVFKETGSSTVYLPLAYSDNSEFTETGRFYAAFTAIIDAVTGYSVSLSDKILVPFTDGRGTLDILTLPAAPPPPAVITENERDLLEKTGHFLKLTRMPLHTQAANVMSVQIANSVSTIAILDKNNSVKVFKETPYSAVYLPLAYADNSEFTETGSFYAAFTIHVDAVTGYAVSLSDKILATFTDGRGTLDVSTLPASPPPPDPEDPPPALTQDERDQLEKTGHFLKLTHMPLNTQAANVMSVQIANSVSTVAKLNKDENVRIFQETASSTVYLPLAYNNDSAFRENGSFYAAFTVIVDAVTSYALSLNDKFLVSFTDGRGTLDIRTLPYKGPPSADRRYLTIYNLPPHLLAQNISKVFVHNQNGPIAQCEDYSLIEVSSTDAGSAASIPLIFTNPPSTFTGTGSFYVAFDLFIDALSHFTVTAADRVLVPFVNGNGFLDVLNFPSATADNRFLTITNLPSNVLPQNVSNVFVHNQTGPVAYCENYDLLEVSASGNTAAVRIPLHYVSSKTVFSGSGVFYVSFNINIDALTSFTATVEKRASVPFTNGNGSFNINNMPSAPAADHRYLTITNLPSNTLPQNVSEVFIHNQAGQVAQCENYDLVSVSASGGSASARIPLSYTSSKSVFSGTGSFYVSFNINIDAVTSFTATVEKRVSVTFTNGNGSFNINNLPPAPVPDHRYLTITNLPPDLLPQNFSDVFIHNKAGQIAKCESYDLILVSAQGGSSSARIPLSYDSPKSVFTGTGSFYVSFNIYVDAVTYYVVTPPDRLIVPFSNGNGSLNIKEVFFPRFTIKGLPLNVTQKHFSAVSVRNMSGQVAICPSYDDIVILKDSASASAIIPLVYLSDNESYFADTGSFSVTFTITIDMNVQFSYDMDDGLVLQFTNGTAMFDLSADLGGFTGGLLNPNDALPLVIRKNTEFELSGTRMRVPEDTLVPLSMIPSSTAVLYLYASGGGGNVPQFEYSTQKPAYFSGRGGYFSGDKRALYKMIFIKDDSGFRLVQKTYIDDDFPQMAKFDASSSTASLASLPTPLSLSGGANPAPSTVTLQPGVYAFKVTGAGGGGGAGFSKNGAVPPLSGSAGGQGGFYCEIITLKSPASFTAFTGSGGSTAPAPAPAGGLEFLCINRTTGSTMGTVYRLWKLTFGSISSIPGSGGGGGGGGSGSFVCSDAESYLLSAGGGGGGSGGSFYTPGGAGGGGGSIGPGGGGGAAGYLFHSTGYGFNGLSTITLTANNGHGGKGGGLNAGSGGSASNPVMDEKHGAFSGPADASGLSGLTDSNARGGLHNLTSYAFPYDHPVFQNNLAYDNNNYLSSPPSYSATDGGAGGGSAGVYSSWASTADVGGIGANSQHLDRLRYYVVPRNSGIGQEAYYNDFDPYIGESFSNPLATADIYFNPGPDWITPPDGKNGLPGSAGGNNRNASKGGGAAAGSPGSVTIYKID